MLSRLIQPTSIIRRVSFAQSGWGRSTVLANFATLYEKNKQMEYYERVYKSTNLKFENQGLTMLVYQWNPNLNELNSPSIPKIRQIISNKVILISFLAGANEGMENDIWNNRRTMNLNIRECMSLLKLNPLKMEKLEISQVFPTSEEQVQRCCQDLEIKYNKEDNSVTLSIFYFKQKNQNRTHVWDLIFSLSLNQYNMLCEWVRSSLYYTSGAALMLEHSKEYQLLMGSIQIKERPVYKKKN